MRRLAVALVVVGSSILLTPLPAMGSHTGATDLYRPQIPCGRGICGEVLRILPPDPDCVESQPSDAPSTVEHVSGYDGDCPTDF